MENSHAHTWQLGSTTVWLLVEEKEDLLLDFVKNRLKEDIFSSLSLIKQELPGSGNIGLCICTISGEKCYSLVSGGASLYLLRDGKEIPLIKTEAGITSIVSGSLKEGDTLKLVTGHKSDVAGRVQGGTNQALSTKAVGVLDKIIKKLPERKIVVHGGEEKSTRSRKASLIGLVFLVLLGISIYFGMGRREQNLAREQYEPQLAEAKHDFDEALELKPISENRARELILKSRDTVDSLLAQGVEDERLTALSEDISSHLGEVAGVYDTPAGLFLDLTIVSSGFDAADLAISEGVVRVLDSSGKRLVGIEVSNKRTNVIAGPDYLPDALGTAAYADRSFVLSSDGVREVTDEVSLVIHPEWNAEDVLVAAFAGNFYILDKGNEQIWRHPGIRGGFLEGEPWLGGGFSINMSDVVSWAIDGSIWTINSEGEFNVYSLGAPVKFSVDGNSMPFSRVSALYTDENSKYVYVLDQGNARVSVIKKTGEYVGEYVAPELSHATDLVVDEESVLLLFLSDKKLYSIKANHLEATNEDSQ